MGASVFSLQASGLGMREKPMQELLGLDIRRQGKKKIRRMKIHSIIPDFGSLLVRKPPSQSLFDTASASSLQFWATKRHHVTGNQAHRGCSVSFGFGHSGNAQSPSLTSRTQFTTALMDTFEQQPYNGISAKLCLAFDIGTSFSSISYCILSPGQVPVIRNVNRCGPPQNRLP